MVNFYGSSPDDYQYKSLLNSSHYSYTIYIVTFSWITNIYAPATTDLFVGIFQTIKMFLFQVP